MPRVASIVATGIIALSAGVLGTVIVGGFIDVPPAAADGELTVEVLANGEPADSAPGPTVQSGATVNLRYVISVGSSEPLFDFVVSNLTGDVRPNCDTDGDGQPDGSDGHPGPLSNGDSFTCVASVVAGEPDVTYSSIGRVTAYSADITQTFVHDDAAHYSTSPAPTTQPPTTQPPATQPPTTAAPITNPTTTQAPSTAPTEPPTSATSEATSSSSAPSSSTESTSTTEATASSLSTSSTMPATSSTADATDEDDAAPSELAAVDDDDGGGFPAGWVVLAFAVGGAVATGVATQLSGKNAAVPDQ